MEAFLAGRPHLERHEAFSILEAWPRHAVEGRDQAPGPRERGERSRRA
jgi:hypothetical protein